MAAQLEIEISALTKGLTDGLKKAESQLQAFSSKAVSLGKTLSLAVTAPILAIGAASIKSASDTEESFSKFDTVFKNVAKSAQNSFEILRNEYGLSSLEAKSLLANTGDLLTGFGFTQRSALDLATQVNKLAVDLASFTNFAGGAEGASKALTSALLGEREAVKALGISILEEDVKKQVAINSAKGLVFETERQAKAYATLDIAISQSQNAIGDYSRTSESFANQTRLLRARISDLASEFGEVILPIATKLVSSVTGLINGFTGLDKQTKTIIITIAGLAAGIGPLLLGIGALIQALPLLAVGFSALTGPIGLVVTAVSVSATLIIANFDQIKINLALLGLEFIKISKDILLAIDSIVSSIPGFKSVTTGALLALESIGKRLAQSFVESLSNKAVNSVEVLEESLNKAKKTGGLTFEEFSKAQDKVNKAFFESGSLIELEIFNLQNLKKIADDVAGTYDKLGQSILKSISTPEIVDIGDPTQGFTPTDVIPDFDDSKATKFLLKLEEFKNQVGVILSDQVANTIGDFAFAIGDAIASGGNVLEAAGAALLGGIASILNQLGQLAIATGIAIGGIKAALLTLNPVVAIAAGTALVALAGFVSNKARSLGGNVGGSGGGVGGSVAQSQTLGGTGAFNNPNDFFSNVVFEIEGTRLVGVLQRTQDKYASG